MREEYLLAINQGYDAFDGETHFLDNPYGDDEQEITLARHWLQVHVNAFIDNREKANG